MAIPLYVRGQAKPDLDGPFHRLEAQLQAAKKHETDVTGEAAARLLRCLGEFGLEDDIEHPLLHDCSYLLAKHSAECGLDCEHSKSCTYSAFGWRTAKLQDYSPYASHLSDDVAQQLINFHIQDIEQLRKALLAKLHSYGDVVLRRWKKMSKDKRGRLLSDVSPRVFGKWPFVIGTCPSGTCFEEHYHSWFHGRWLNLRDFSDDWMRLICALRVRTKHGAPAWAAFDLQQSNLAWVMRHVPVWFNSKSVMMCGEDFGTLDNYDEELVHTQIAIGFPRALLVLQGQHELLYTLASVVETLIEDREPSGAASWNLLVSNGLHSAGCDVSWNLHIHQAFGDPMMFCPETLHRKATERLSMVNDELALLQTDARYAVEVIKSRKVAFRNAVGTSNREASSYVAGSLTLELCIRFEMWHTISSRCWELLETIRHYGVTPSPGSSLPHEVGTHISALRILIDDWIWVSSDSFEDATLTKRKARQRQSRPRSSSHLYPDETGAQLNAFDPHDRLKLRIKDLRDLAETSSQLLTGNAKLFEDIEREEDAAGVMDRPVREHVNDRMLLDELAKLLNWARQIESYEASPGIEGRWEKVGKDCCQYDDPDCRPARLDFQNGWQDRVGELVQSLMDAPWPKGRKDLNWLNKADLTRNRAGQLWQGISQEYSKAEKAGGQYSACGAQLVSAMTRFASDLSHLAELEKERELCRAESERLTMLAAKRAVVHAPFVAQSQWGPVGSPGTRDFTKDRKVKTKATPAGEELEHQISLLSVASSGEHLASCCHDNHGSSADTADCTTHSRTPQAPISIEVAKASLSVFQKMYRADAESSSGGIIRWQAFVQAMKDAGFRAEEAAGSAVSFRNEHGGSICFQRPHPDPVLHPIMLYAMAKRMTKWFGVGAETFVLRDQEAAA